ILLYLDLEFWEGTLKTLTPSLQENAKYFTTRSYLTLTKFGGGAGVPLRYNYDKPENPRRIKGFEVFSLVFSSFSKPKNHTEISRIIGGVSLTTNE
ncbi:hypothetical protein, partial [Enterocloster clostridioformis]|uniref:hypothetical protein n=1 Tax=Enterocloster clostridioformis TaxID=1531 RepID=UPI001A9A37DE